MIYTEIEDGKGEGRPSRWVTRFRMDPLSF